MSNSVITRFAPSPTGFLHIGGARTALFNWLYAKANNGKMLLRIEDTDQARSNEKAVTAIMDGLSWLGLEWDGEAVSQFSRAGRHREIAEKMVDQGTAYRCTCTAETVESMRERALAEGRPVRYNGTCRDMNRSRSGPYVIRIKTPQDGKTLVFDKVQGDIAFPNNDLDDFILLRSNGTPTYMLAVVVDDHDMGVTHIIRGDDHLTNAARQSLIYQACNWNVPVMAHIPLIHGADGAKLSKRHGAIGAEAYRAMGYLAPAMRNYLVRLGWAHGNDEIMSTTQIIDWFGFEGMNKGAAHFDINKLDAINNHYLRKADPEALIGELEAVLPEFENERVLLKVFEEPARTWFANAIPSLAERSKTLVELVDRAHFIFAKRPIPLDEKATALLDDTARTHIAALIPRFEKLQAWHTDSFGSVIREYAAEGGFKLGEIAQPVRAALTGSANSPGAFDVLGIFGKEESLARLADFRS